MRKTMPLQRSTVPKNWPPPEPLAAQLIGFKLEPLGDELKITRPWFHLGLFIFFLAFYLFGHFLLIAQWYALAGRNLSESARMLFACLLVSLTAGMIVLDYFGLASCLNRTVVQVTPQ